jgi:alpha-D-ribose 1-methylphosphonate 5-triphosphate synthase subunit PhnH
MQPDTIIHDHATFRILLRAMSRPGSIGQLPRHREASGQRELLVGLLRCLIDNEVSFFVLDDTSGQLSGEISRSTGSSRRELAAADFLIFPEGTSKGTVTGARRGTLEYPDSGATAVYLVESLAETGGPVALTGPGIDGAVHPSIGAPAGAELALLREANAEFPLGLDAIFLDRDGRVICIPRSTRIGEN